MATKGRIKKSIKKFTSGVKSGFASVPAKNQTSNSGYSIGAYSSKPSTSKLQNSTGFYPTPNGKAPVAQSKYSISGMKNAPQSSYLTNLSTQKKTTFPIKPATTFGGQTLVPSKPVGGQTKVPLNYTPVPGVSGPQTLVPTNTGGTSGGSTSQFGSPTIGTPAQVNGPVDAVDTTAVEKGVTTSSAPTGGTVSTARTGTTTAPTGSTATAGATTTGSGITLAPAGSEGYLGGYDYSLSNEERAQQEAYKEEQAYYEKQKNDRVDRNQIMRDALRQFQGEIDATNSVYADKLKQSQLAGLDRLGQSRAENFNAGAVNSSFGNAALERVGAYNRDAEGAVNNEKLQLISSIESAARAAGDKYYQEKKAAKEAGFEAYMASLTNAKSAKETISNNIANNILSSGFDVSQIEPSKLESIAKSAGVSVQSIKSAFDEAKKLAEAEQAQAEQEAAKAERESQFNLSERQARYDQYGNLIASRAKTYAPKSYEFGGSGVAGLSGFSSDVQSAAQAIYDGKAKLNEFPSAKRLQINEAFSKLYTAEGGNDLAQGAYDAISELETNKGFKAAIGSNFLLGAGKNIQGSRSAGFLAELDKLKANLKLVNIKYLKGTGAISDAEGKTLEDASTSLNPRLNEAQFRKELARVKAALLKASNIQTNDSVQAIAPEDDALLAEFGL